MIEEVLKHKKAILFKFRLRNNLVDSFICNIEKNPVVIQCEKTFYKCIVACSLLHIKFYSNIKISCHFLSASFPMAGVRRGGP